GRVDEPHVVLALRHQYAEERGVGDADADVVAVDRRVPAIPGRFRDHDPAGVRHRHMHAVFGADLAERDHAGAIAARPTLAPFDPTFGAEVVAELRAVERLIAR